MTQSRADSSSPHEVLTWGLCHYKSQAPNESYHGGWSGYHGRPDPHQRVGCYTTADSGNVQKNLSSPRRSTCHGVLVDFPNILVGFCDASRIKSDMTGFRGQISGCLGHVIRHGFATVQWRAAGVH